MRKTIIVGLLLFLSSFLITTGFIGMGYKKGYQAGVNEVESKFQSYSVSFKVPLKANLVGFRIDRGRLIVYSDTGELYCFPLGIDGGEKKDIEPKIRSTKLF